MCHVDAVLHATALDNSVRVGLYDHVNHKTGGPTGRSRPAPCGFSSEIRPQRAQIAILTRELARRVRSAFLVPGSARRMIPPGGQEAQDNVRQASPARPEQIAGSAYSAASACCA